jgi:hypothetical protein
LRQCQKHRGHPTQMPKRQDPGKGRGCRNRATLCPRRQPVLRTSGQMPQQWWPLERRTCGTRSWDDQNADASFATVCELPFFNCERQGQEQPNLAQCQGLAPVSPGIILLSRLSPQEIIAMSRNAWTICMSKPDASACIPRMGPSCNIWSSDSDKQLSNCALAIILRFARFPGLIGSSDGYSGREGDRGAESWHAGGIFKGSSLHY